MLELILYNEEIKSQLDIIGERKASSEISHSNFSSNNILSDKNEQQNVKRPDETREAPIKKLSNSAKIKNIAKLGFEDQNSEDGFQFRKK